MTKGNMLIAHSHKWEKLYMVEVPGENTTNKCVDMSTCDNKYFRIYMNEKSIHMLASKGLILDQKSVLVFMVCAY